MSKSTCHCGAWLVIDQSGWLHCPRGCGKLTCELECGEEDSQIEEIGNLGMQSAGQDA